MVAEFTVIISRGLPGGRNEPVREVEYFHSPWKQNSCASKYMLTISTLLHLNGPENLRHSLILLPEGWKVLSNIEPNSDEQWGDLEDLCL